MRLQFELDPQIIHHIIYSQAGSIGKALIELIMNSVDAGAKSVQLEITKSGFRISDDGNGFVSREDVLRYFGRFGTPHEDGDATFGRFRLGRGQIMAHAKTWWRSNNWAMSVDTREHGYAYDLEDLLEPVPGCSIDGHWYTELDEQEYLSAYQELRDLVRYTPVTVNLNGKVITRLPVDEKWDAEDEYAFYRLRSSGSMAIYNQGVLVRHDPGHVWGVGGTIVSKKAIALNVSRTEILRKSCPVWQAIAKRTKTLASAFLEKEDPRRKSENSRHLAAKNLLAGGHDSLRIAVKEQIITVLPGARHISWEEFASLASGMKGVTIVPHGEDLPKAEGIAYNGIAVVVHPKTLERFGAQSPLELEEMFAQVQENISTVQQQIQEGKIAVNDELRYLHWKVRKSTRQLNFVLYEVLAEKFVQSMTVVDDKELKDKELRRTWRALRWCLQQYATLIRPPREGARRIQTRGGICRELYGPSNSWLTQIPILIGRSNVAEAWTDGSSYIAINIRVIERLAKEGLKAASYIFSLVEHEVAHDGDSIDAVHDGEFYARFHEIAVNHADTRQWYVYKWLVKYCRSLEHEGKWEPRGRRYGWSTSHLNLVERAGNGRRQQGQPGLIDDIGREPDMASAIPDIDSGLLSFVNASLKQDGDGAAQIDWAEIEELSTGRRRALKKDADLRAAYESEQDRLWNDYQDSLKDVAERVSASLGLTLEDVLPIADRFDDDESSWRNTWEAFQAELDELERENSQSEADYEQCLEDFSVESWGSPKDFEALNGRKHNDLQELQDWHEYGQPALRPGESMWMLIRNAATVGLGVQEYIAWRNEQQS